MDCLSLMFRNEARNSFYFDNYFVLYKKVGTKFANRVLLVEDWYRCLPYECDLPEIQLFSKRVFINGFQEPRPKEAVDLHG